ncbi:hypothetical protein JTB14_038261 [Gonioctena quinquepunctata]|nr:hypothetical protein JTB14_038261 [Gonioctena quinquepunctata]
MLRYLLIKLPGFNSISDNLSSPRHVRMLRSLSPVKHDCRRDSKRSNDPKDHKRSYSFPSARMKTDVSERYQGLYYPGTYALESRNDRVLQRRDLSQKMKKSKKNSNEHVEVEKANEIRTQRQMKKPKELYEVTENPDGRYQEFYHEQYELESAKPRKSKSEMVFNVFEFMEKRENEHDPISHLQPHNMRPFGATGNFNYPVLMTSKSTSFLRYPQSLDDAEPFTEFKAEKSSRMSEDMQQRGYSTSSQTNIFRPDEHVEMIYNLPPIPTNEISPDQEEQDGKIVPKDSLEDDSNGKYVTDRETADKSFKMLKIPWTDQEGECDEMEPHVEEPLEIFEEPFRIGTPWPSYADTLKSQPSDSASIIGEHGCCRKPQAAPNPPSQEHPEELYEPANRKRFNFLQKSSNVSQRRALSTEPVLTQPPQRTAKSGIRSSRNQAFTSTKISPPEKPDVKYRSYSRKQRPLEPTFNKEKPPHKCFMPSKIRLKPPPCTPKPPPCPVEEPCVRADDCLEIKSKRLPKIPLSDCPCVEPVVPDMSPKLRRLEMTFQDPPRICPCDTCECPPRADDNLVEKPKKLLPLKARPCPCVEPPPMVDVPLKRLHKVCIPEEKCFPKRECPKEEPCVRADDTLIVCDKPLPQLKAGSCPCIEVEIPDKNPKLRRLKFSFEDTPRLLPCDTTPPCPPRADDNLVPKPKKLPKFKANDCRCIEPPPMIDVPLKRLHKVCIPEEKCNPKRECLKPEPCVRADDCLEIKPKKLPALRLSPCLCVEPFVPDKMPDMRRLQMHFKDEPRVCPCDTDCPCPPRADDSLQPKVKKLPHLRRLQKVCIPEEKCVPKRVCPEPEPCVRADDSLCVEPRSLPHLEAKFCPCVEEPPLQEAPPLKRLNLKVAEPPRVCPKLDVCDESYRADDSLREKRRKLPSLKPGDCPCVDKPMVDTAPLKRLICEDEPQECLDSDPCMDNPRSDMGCWEYYMPEKEKCDTKSKKKKKGVSVETRRKYNTDSRLSLFGKLKESTQKKSPTDNNYSLGRREPLSKNVHSSTEPGNLNKISDAWKRKNTWFNKKKVIANVKETYKRTVFRSTSTPTIMLLKELQDREQKKYNKIIFEVSKEKKLDVKNIMKAVPKQTGPISLPNVRNLSTVVHQASRVESTRLLSTNRGKKGSRKKKKIKPVSTCHKIGSTATCELAKLPCASEKCIKSCKKTTPPLECCDKKSPPYPAFSDLMEEEVEPFSDTKQWTCNRKEYGFYPRYKKLNNPITDEKRKHYTTSTASRRNVPGSEQTQRSNGTRSVNITRKQSQNSGKPIQTPTSKSSGNNSTNENRSPVTNNAVPSKCHQLPLQKSSMGGANSNFTKIFTMHRNSPLSFKLHEWGNKPQHGLQIVRGISYNLSRERIKFTKIGAVRNESNNRGDVSKKCDKKTKCDKKMKCPKFKYENCCPPQIRHKCKEDHPVICEKPEAPFRSFTDCLDEELAENLSECPLEVEKVRALQPRYMEPVEKVEKKAVEPVTPVLGLLDVKKEERCIKDKLCMENKGLSQSCDEFGKFQKPLRVKDFKDPDKECLKTDDMRKLGKWPPKNSRGLCTGASSIFVPQKRNISKLVRKHITYPTKTKEEMEKHKKLESQAMKDVPSVQNKVRSYHVLCMKPEKRLGEDNDNKINEVSHHGVTEDDSCRYNKLRNVQWRINNFQKWHRLDKLGRLPGYIKRFYSNIDISGENLSAQKQKPFSTSASQMAFFCETPDVPTHRAISTSYMLAQGKKNKFRYFHVRKEKKSTKVSKSCPKFTLTECPPKKRFDCERKYIGKPCKKRETPYTSFSDHGYEELESKITECPRPFSRLQPQYPILPETETATINDSTFQGKVDPTIEEEYKRHKYGIAYEGVTQDCSTFGKKIKPLRTRMANRLHKDGTCTGETDARAQTECVEPIELSSVCFSSSATVERSRRNDKKLEKDCQGQKFQKKRISANVCQKIELTIPNAYKTCPEPPKDSMITQQQSTEDAPEPCPSESPTPEKEKQISQEDCAGESQKELTVWQKIANYFKARPNCPAPDEWKKKAAREKAEKYAKAAGLVVIDPKDLPPKKETCAAEELPRVITPRSGCSGRKSIIGRKCYSTVTLVQQRDRSGGRLDNECYRRPFHTMSEGKIGSHVTDYGSCVDKVFPSVQEFESCKGFIIVTNETDIFKKLGSTSTNLIEGPDVGNSSEVVDQTTQSKETGKDETFITPCSSGASDAAYADAVEYINSASNNSFTLREIDDKNLKTLKDFEIDEWGDYGSVEDLEQRTTDTGGRSGDTPPPSRGTIDGGNLLAQENTRKGSVLNGKSPFITVMKRYYSKNTSWRNLEEINKSLEEEEKKKLAKRVLKPFVEGTTVLNDSGCDDIVVTGQKNAENYDEGVSNKNCFEAEDEIPNVSCNTFRRKLSFFDVMFQEPIHGASGYNQAKTFAAFQEYFRRIEVLSDINYEDMEKNKTSKMVKELNKLIDDEKKPEEN